MRRREVLCWMVVSWIGILMLSTSSSFALDVGPSDAMIKEAYKSLLPSLDANKDGKLTASECMTLSKDKKKAEKDCKYWDANSDGVITEEEYVQQVKKIMR